jgi:hypothetical protein
LTKKRRKPAKRFLVDGVDLGDGEPQRCWFVIDGDGSGVTVYGYRRRRRWWLPLRDAASVIAVKAQVRLAQSYLGKSPPPPAVAE